MRRLIILVIALFLVFQITSAQPESSRVVIPKDAILPPGYTCTMTVFADGKINQAPAKVAAYVIWTDRALTLEYYVSDDLNGVRYWSVLSRDSLDAVCK